MLYFHELNINIGFNLFYLNYDYLDYSINSDQNGILSS